MLQGFGPLQTALAILAIGLIIAWHEFGHYIVARALGMRVLKYSIGFGPKLWGIRVGEIDYQIAALPFGGFVQVKGMTPLEEGAVSDPRSFIMRPRWARWLMLAAGPAFNYLMAAFFFFLYLALWPSPVGTTAIEIGAVTPNGPAATAQLQVGDMITAVAGEPVDGVLDLRQKLGAADKVTLTLWRNGGYLDVEVAPVQGRIGIAPNERYPEKPLHVTAVAAIAMCVDETVSTMTNIAALFRREPGADVGGPIAVVKAAKDNIDKGASYFVHLLAIVSVSLGLLNLLPVPALDGIKMLVLTIEGIFRRNLNAAFQVWMNAIGVLAIFGLMLVLLVRDGLRLIPG